MPQFFAKKDRLGLQVITTAGGWLVGVRTHAVATMRRRVGEMCHYFIAAHLVNLCAHAAGGSRVVPGSAVRH